jgi:hypothetical protein
MLSPIKLEHVYDIADQADPTAAPHGTRSEQMNAPWVRSSFSFANGNCVEVAELPGASVGIRDSRDPDGPVLRFTRAEWRAFLGGARRGELERSRRSSGESRSSAPGDGRRRPSSPRRPARFSS